MRQGVLTTYIIHDNKFASYIIGNNLQEVEKKLFLRGMNEIIESDIMPIQGMPDYSKLEKEEFIKNLPEILHTACYLGFVALKAQTMTFEEILGDEGIIHELTHILTHTIPVTDSSVFNIMAKFTQLQNNALGFY